MHIKHPFGAGANGFDDRLHADIEVDGGINTDNVRAALDAGANIIVAGSAVFKGDAAENVKKFKELM